MVKVTGLVGVDEPVCRFLDSAWGAVFSSLLLLLGGAVHSLDTE